MGGLKNIIQQMGFDMSNPMKYKSDNYFDKESEFLSQAYNGRPVYCRECSQQILELPRVGSDATDFNFIKKLHQYQLCEKCYGKLLNQYG